MARYETPVANLSGQKSRYKVDVISDLGQSVVAAYRSSLTEATLWQTRQMEADLSAALRNVTFDHSIREGGVYQYPAKNTGRRYEHGGLADDQYYAFEAITNSDEMQIVFYQKEEIPTESMDDTWQEWDTRKIVEYGGNRQPFPRPYFDFVALELAKTLPQDIESRIAKSMRMRGF